MSDACEKKYIQNQIRWKQNRWNTLKMMEAFDLKPDI